MAPSERPAKKMVSRCNPVTERGTLVFDIAGYSLLKGMGDGKFIRSSSFPVGGHGWCIGYYPNGEPGEDSKGYVSVHLERLSKSTGNGVLARFDLRLLNQATGVSKVLTDQATPRLFSDASVGWGTQKFMKTSELETSPYLKDDRIVIESDITVVLKTPVSALEAVCEIQVPPSDLSDDLRKLLETEKRTDIAFKVKEEQPKAKTLFAATAAAHNISTRRERDLPPAMRSQVRAAALLAAALSASVFGRRASNFSVLQRRLPPLLRPAAGRAAFSTLPSSPAAAAAQVLSSQSPPAPAPAPSHQAPITTTRSSCNPETARGRHVFTVAGYSLLKGLGVGRFVRSSTFAVGGYDWCVRYCPDGDGGHGGDDGGADVFLALMTRDAEVRALFDFRFLNPATGGLSPSAMSMERPILFNDAAWSFGYRMFQKGSNLEASEYLRDDCLVIQCDVTVIKGTPGPQSETACDDIVHSTSSDIQAVPCDIQASSSDIEAPPCDTKAPPSDAKALLPSFDIQVPPSVLDIQSLFEAVRKADVMIIVKGQVFHAHRSVIAMRMPVFFELEHGELTWISIDHIEPAVFKALLHFIYTDSFLDMDDLKGDDEKRETVKGLLQAADSYGLDRLKLMCESILCKELSVDNVAATLDLAIWHHCKQLKDACIGFITSPGRINDVVATDGYKRLRVACPSVIKEISEKEIKSSKI
ncbi:unnamed protein product [Urochloa decumbens]|uniref:Uncharacterized protein n=1 Tax=Urochloa decumbens TaxID=240449 RepID=A0ABC9BTW5_9POAL